MQIGRLPARDDDDGAIVSSSSPAHAVLVEGSESGRFRRRGRSGGCVEGVVADAVIGAVEGSLVADAVLVFEIRCA